MNWGEMFRLTMNPFELIVRGTATYWFIIILFRVLLRRSVGAVGIADLLLLVLIADAAPSGCMTETAVAGGFWRQPLPSSWP